MPLSGKSVAVLIEDMFNEFELIYPFYRLQEAGAKVTVVGTQGQHTYHAKSGLGFTSHKSVGEVSPEEFDGLVIPGGYAPDHMRRHKATVQLVKDIFAAGKPVGTICHAGWMLASAEVVDGKRCTSFFAIKDDLVHAGAAWEDAEVVVDGNLITSRTPDDLPAFMKAFIAAF
ncbi:MAG: type 1 glutamine amidotransferase [Desulfarculaceae bacterium]|nr:type 1 glutamine amidotransferase [Desulfarculaceae bacterium]MCF8071374.1 type 1 glutamine amidotransferase [Desulfarculaceae bacterium]MCF8101699.1 type 1 glutamine amidotransferase [Desulfarculaceae bacterium]MCF8116692.1 type 1 glutamine amidotransferase [Desulfarculaceae bacterium]